MQQANFPFMQTATLHTTYQTEADLRSQALAEAGFKKSGKGFRKGNTTLKQEKGWVTLTTNLPKTEGQSKLGACGLWKLQPQKATKQEFSFPENLISPTNAMAVEHSVSLFADGVRWAMETKKNTAPSDWISPSEEDIENWLGSRTLQIGNAIRQLECKRSEDKLALRVSILGPVPRERNSHLSWLDRLIADAQEQWTMARIEFRQLDTNTDEAVAEIDLTGAPSQILQPLFLTSVDTLRWIAASLVPTAEFLASDSASLSQALNDATIKGQQS